MDLNSGGGPTGERFWIVAALWGRRTGRPLVATGEVSAATGRGTLHVIAWVLGAIVIGGAGVLLVPSLGRWWVVIALAVMTGVALLRDRRAAAGDRSTTA